VSAGTRARWSDWRRWMWLARTCLAGLLLADISFGHPAPGLSGRHLVLLAGSVLAALTWIAWLPTERVSAWIRVPVLIAGMVGACLAALVSPGTAAAVLPLVIGVMAGSSYSVLEGAWAAACGLVTLGTGSLIANTPGFSLLGACASVVGGLLAGLWRSQYRLRAEEAELAAAQTQRAEQEHIRAQVLDERTRIAREIHDILAHTLGGLVVQLDAADALLGEAADPAGGRRLVGDARRLAVKGLEEARQAIAALRTDPVDLPEALAALAASTGWREHVSYEVLGTPRRLASDVGLAILRTTQEALANARKHAPGATVAVTLSFEERTTGLRVVSAAPADVPRAGPGEPLAATGGGYGLTGLTERAELLGAKLRAGPDGDDWVVELTVPG
jgi:signal transduction histidine kinase